MKPYGILSDLHLHPWNAFAKAVASTLVGAGELMNDRLSGLLGEVNRCANEVEAAGGKTIYITGDLFHVRGSVAPSVLNPTLDVFKALIKRGFVIRVLPGNHDLEGKHSTRVGSAVTALESVGVEVIHTATHFPEHNVVMIPWIEDIETLKKVATEMLEKSFDSAPSTPVWATLMIHAPIDGVIPGLPDHGLSPEEAAELGYGRVFSGHYHAHKVFAVNDVPDSVISVGAIAHHTWNDVNTKAGFLIISDAGVDWRASQRPSFVDIDGSMDKGEAELLADGNYVRLKTNKATAKQVEELREWMLGAGAAGVVIQHIKEATSARATTATVKTGASLETSVGEYIASQSLDRQAEVTRIALECLAEAGA
jgi:DNA repair exonuclease SbcCD nuclease subunit